MVKLTKEHLILAHNVARLRVAGQMTQERLARSSGIHLRYLQKIERGSTLFSVNVLICIRRALGCSWQALFRGIV